MLSEIARTFESFVLNAQIYLYQWVLFFVVLWAINIFNWMLGSPLNVFGIYPRNAFGLLGIVISPVLHKNFNHLFFNTIPLFALGLVLLARGLPLFEQVTAIVVVLGGFGVWLFARKALHIGASGVVSGYFGYILATAYFDPNATSIVLGVVVAYYFGSIFFGIFPQEDKISWESHLFGFLAGIAGAFILDSNLLAKNFPQFFTVGKIGL